MARNLYDDLVADVSAGLRVLVTLYGFDIPETAISDRANNIVQGIVCNYDVRPVTKEAA